MDFLPRSLPLLCLCLLLSAAAGHSQDREDRAPASESDRPTTPPTDAIQAAQVPTAVPVERPEQKKTQHDEDVSENPAAPSSPALENQPDAGKMEGFDFVRDPLGSKKPKVSFDEIMAADIERKPEVMAAQQALLESRYDLTPRPRPDLTMTRGKPILMGPTAKLKDTTWEKLGEMTPAEIKEGDLFPYPALPHPKHTPGGQVFPRMQIALFPRLERFDVD